MSQADTNKILELFSRYGDEIITKAELERRLASGKKLRIKYGVDVTAPTLHIGHAVNLWLMRAMQDMGHKVLFLIGDFTTRIGDPTGKSKTRPIIPQEEIEKNLKEFIEQAKMVLRFDKQHLEIHHNSDWFDKMPTSEFLQKLMMITHARLIERDMFQERIKAHKDIYMHELIYPILQGWDSVELKSDITIIGSDQLFNEMLGRFYQEKMGQTPQMIVTTKITPGLDGAEKQSKSIGNYVGLAHDPLEKYGRIMTLPDELIIEWFRVYTDVPLDQIEQIEKDMSLGDNPRDTKASLARHIVARYHGEKAATEAEAAWNKQFREGGQPDEIQQHKLKLPINIIDAIADVFGISKSEARRLVSQKGVKFAGKVVDKPETELKKPGILQLGKRRYAEILKK